jgi:hypothetical protein
MQPSTHSPESPPRRLLQVEFAGKPPGPKIARGGKTSAKQRRNAANHSCRRAALAPTGSIAQPAPSSQLPAPADTPPDDTRRHAAPRHDHARARRLPADTMPLHAARATTPTRQTGPTIIHFVSSLLTLSSPRGRPRVGRTQPCRAACCALPRPC